MIVLIKYIRKIDDFYKVNRFGPNFGEEDVFMIAADHETKVKFAKFNTADKFTKF